MNVKKWSLFIVVFLLIAAIAAGCGGNGDNNNGNVNNDNNNNGNDVGVVEGPSFGHGTEGAYENCMTCHSGIADDHEANYGAGFEDSCLDCHEAL